MNDTYYISLSWCYNNKLSDAIKIYSECLSLDDINHNFYDILFNMLNFDKEYFNNHKFVLDGDTQILIDPLNIIMSSIDLSKGYIKIIAYNNPDKIYQIKFNYLHRRSHKNKSINFLLSDFDAENKLLDILEDKVYDYMRLVHYSITTPNSHIPIIIKSYQLNNTFIKDNNLKTCNLININAINFATMLDFDEFIANIKNDIVNYFK